MREASEMFYSASPVLLKREHASDSPEGLLTQTDGPHPRVSGSIDVEEQGLRINISNMFFVWALRLLKIAVHSVQGHKTDQVGAKRSFLR